MWDNQHFVSPVDISQLMRWHHRGHRDAFSYEMSDHLQRCFNVIVDLAKRQSAACLLEYRPRSLPGEEMTHHYIIVPGLNESHGNIESADNTKTSSPPKDEGPVCKYWCWCRKLCACGDDAGWLVCTIPFHKTECRKCPWRFRAAGPAWQTAAINHGENSRDESTKILQG
jgi:hypothetical protein